MKEHLIGLVYIGIASVLFFAAIIAWHLNDNGWAVGMFGFSVLLGLAGLVKTDSLTDQIEPRQDQ